MAQNYTTATVMLEKSWRSSVTLKIVGVTPQLDQNFKPTRNLSGHFLYVLVYMGRVFHIYLTMKKIKAPF